MKAVTLDELLAGQTPGLVKMDIEGAEIMALEGATSLLQGADTNWLIELHDFTDPQGRNPVEVVPAMMAELGYRTIVIGDKHLFSRHPWQVAPLAYCGTMPRLLGRRIRRALTPPKAN
ncbi:MAG: FkbM family methyltransferase [Verrucomicrobiota bacterium]